MTFRELCSLVDTYKTPTGLVGAEPGQDNQNGALFTMEAILMVKSHIKTSIEQSFFNTWVEQYLQAMRRLEKYPGVTARGENGNEHNSMDNVCAEITFSVLFDDGALARRMYEHGRTVVCDGNDTTQNPEGAKRLRPLAWLLGPFRTRWFWNCEDPGKFCEMGWHGRSPGHMAALRAAGGRWFTPWGFFALAVGQMWGLIANEYSQDGWKLSYLHWQWLKERGWHWRFLYNVWQKKLLDRHPDGMKEVYASYYQDKNHPVVKYSLPIIF